MLELIRRKPTLGLSAWDEDFDRVDQFFDNFLRSFPMPTAALSLPSVNMYKSTNGDSLTIELQAPGFDQDDIQLNVANNVLEVQGERAHKEEKGDKDKDRQWLVRETNASFARRIVLPEGANTENITAELDKGILTVTVPLARAEARRIEIGASTKQKKLTAEAEAK